MSRRPAIDSWRGTGDVGDHGRHKVLFGTNWPMIPPARALEGLAEMQLDAGIAAGFLGANARRVFRL